MTNLHNVAVFDVGMKSYWSSAKLIGIDLLFDPLSVSERKLERHVPPGLFHLSGSIPFHRTNGRTAIRKGVPATDFRLYTFRLCQKKPGQKDSRPGAWMRKTRAWLESVAKPAIDSLVKQGNGYQNPCALKRSDRPALELKRGEKHGSLGDAMPIASLTPSVH